MDHCKSLLAKNSVLLLVSLEYDESQLDGPPFSVPEEELLGYWADRVERVFAQDIIESLPRFKEGGLVSIIEKIYLSKV